MDMWPPIGYIEGMDQSMICHIQIQKSWFRWDAYFSNSNWRIPSDLFSMKQPRMNLFRRNIRFSIITPQLPFCIYTHCFSRSQPNFRRCLSDEIDLYLQRLEIANREMQEDIEILYRHIPIQSLSLQATTAVYHKLMFWLIWWNRSLWNFTIGHSRSICDLLSNKMANQWLWGFWQNCSLQDLFPAVFATFLVINRY